LPLASFSYHMYEVHWYNEGLPEGAQLGGRQSLNYDRADWCVRLSLSPFLSPPPRLLRSLVSLGLLVALLSRSLPPLSFSVCLYRSLCACVWCV
jgi:hypothetical protein